MKMKILQSTLSYMAMLGISSSQNLANLKYFLTEFILISHPCFDYAFLVYEANTFREYTYGIFFGSTTSMAVACFTIFSTKTMHLFKLIDIGEELIEKRSENPIKRAMYMKTNRIAEKWSKIAFGFLAIASPVCFCFPKAILVYWIYFTTDAGYDAFELPYPMCLPFNWKTPIGYAIAIFITYVLTLYLSLMAASMLSSGLEGLLLTNAVMSDLKSYLNEINDSTKRKKNHSKATQQLYEFVQIHSLVIQLLNELLLIIEQISMIFFAWSCVVMCGSMLLFQVEISKPEIDLMALWVIIGLVCYVFFCICVACELGQRVTDVFTSIDIVIEQFNWYRYPVAMKRMFLTFLPIVQKPVDIKCFGSFASNREGFLKIGSGGFSYFTVLRNFTH